MKKDGHIHTPYCPHGSTDSFDLYIKKAIAEGFEEITFTEHAPLPSNFLDPTPNQDSGMDLKYLNDYLNTLEVLKNNYKNKIKINIGLEIDYITGFENETTHFLNTYGPRLDDAILSVHFLKLNNTYTCIDFSENVYLQFSEQIGSIQEMYDLYYETVEQSILADLGPYKPKRIGHPTLIHKFQLAHNQEIQDQLRIQHILQLMKEQQYELDVNSAGLSKPLCKEPYPPYSMIEFAKFIQLPLVFGSDAHIAGDLHQHYELIVNYL